MTNLGNYLFMKMNELNKNYRTLLDAEQNIVRTNTGDAKTGIKSPKNIAQPASAINSCWNCADRKCRWVQRMSCDLKKSRCVFWKEAKDAAAN